MQAHGGQLHEVEPAGIHIPYEKHPYRTTPPPETRRALLLERKVLQRLHP